MDQLMVNLTCAVVTGCFSLGAACVPQYLQSRKSQERIKYELIKKDYYQHSFWNILFGVSIPTVFFFSVATIVLFYLVSALLIAAAHAPDPVAFTSSFDPGKAVDIIRLTAKVELIFKIPLMFAVVLFSAKYIYHRVAKNGILFVSLSVILVLFSEIAVTIPFQNPAWAISDILKNSIIFSFVYLIAASSGIYLAKKSHNRHLVVYTFNRLSKSDQSALLDLAHSILTEEPKRKDPTNS